MQCQPFSTRYSYILLKVVHSFGNYISWRRFNSCKISHAKTNSMHRVSVLPVSIMHQSPLWCVERHLSTQPVPRRDAYTACCTTLLPTTAHWTNSLDLSSFLPLPQCVLSLSPRSLYDSLGPFQTISLTIQICSQLTMTFYLNHMFFVMRLVTCTFYYCSWM